MLESTPETNSKMPENQAEPNNQAELMDQGAPNTLAEPNNQAEPKAQDEPMDRGEEPNVQDEPTNESEVAPNGFWDNLSAEKKRWVTIGAIALGVIVVAIILFPKHRSPEESAKKAPAPIQTAAQAVSDAEQTVMRAPTAENYVNLSAVYYNAKRYGECILAARKTISLKPDFPEAYNNVAAGFLQLSGFDSAITAANEAIRLKPDFQLAKNNLAGAIEGKKKLEDNISKLEKESSEHPTPESYLDLSAAYFQDSKYEKCVAVARKAIALRPKFAAAYNNMCVAYNHLGRFADGKKAGEQAVLIDSTNQLAKNNLNWSIQGLSKKEGLSKK